MGERRILSVDWDPRELRVVHARIRKERVRIEDVFAVAIPQEVALGSAEQLGKLLRHALDQERISSRHVIVDIPRDQVVLNTLALPNVTVSDMAGMVKLQIAKGLPFPISEAVVDFAVPPDDGEEGPRDVLVGAVRTEVVDYYQQVCERAGLRLERIGLRPYANKVAVSSFLSGEPPERVLIVDVGPALTEIDVLRRGQLVFSRAASVFVPKEDSQVVPLVAADEPQADAGPTVDVEASIIPFDAEPETGPRDMAAVVADLMVEVTRSIEAYRGTDAGAQMDCAVVAGATGIEETLAEAIHRRFGVHTETYNPAACLGDDQERGATAAGFSAALGLVLGHGGEGRLHFDFLHPKKQEVPGKAELKKVPLVAAVVALFAVAGAVAYFQGPAKRFARIDELKEQIQESKAEIRDNKGFIEMVQAAKRYEAEQIVWIDEFQNLVALLPNSEKVVLDKLDLHQDDKGKTMKMDVRAADSRQCREIVEKLEDFIPEGRSGQYYTAKMGSASRASTGRYRHEGSITVQVGESKGKKGSKKKSRRAPRRRPTRSGSRTNR
ncbi:MAG: type IV pilus biogenesis protein PilM [Planctomycetota bacterium]